MRATAIQGLVQQLLTQEAAQSQDQDSSQDQDFFLAATERVLNMLHLHLSKRIGQEGFRTLLARALALTSVQFPALSGVRVAADGSLAGLRGTAEADEAEIAEGAAALISQLIALLTTFIGEDLTLRILGSVWPEIAWDDAPSGENKRP
jgi:hypothetical protein